MTDKLPDRKSLVAIVKSDFLASIVVFLVALPLCMGVAVASGAPVAAGLITGIVGGLIVGSLSGCPLQVSGPAAGLTVIVFDIVQRSGLGQLSLVVLIAGLLQVAAGLLGLGQWFRAVSPAVVRGMLAGIGFLILGGQFHVMLDGKPSGDGASNLSEIPAAIQHAWQTADRPDSGPSSERLASLTAARHISAAEAAVLQQFDRLRQRPQVHAPRQTLTPADWQALAASQGEVTEALREFTTRVTGPEQKTISETALASSMAAAECLRAGDEETALAAVRAASGDVNQLLDRSRSPLLAGGLGLATILIIAGWNGLAAGKLKLLPGALIAVVVISVTAAALQLPVLYVDIPGQLWSSIAPPTFDEIRNADWSYLARQAALVAIVASAETLLCASAVDQLHSGARTRYNRELFSQGVGNVLCGCLGALPMTGVIVRSSANVQAGGKTRLSTILHGFWLLVLVSGMTALLRQIPTSCLAAILVYTGYKLVDIRAIRELRDFGWGEIAIYATTVSVIVFADLLTGVVFGMGLSALKLAYTFSHLRIRLQQSPDGNLATLILDGAATFLKLPSLAATLERISPSAEVHVDLTDLDYIDHACLDLLRTWGKQHRAMGGRLVIDWESLNSRFRRDRFRLATDPVDDPQNGAQQPSHAPVSGIPDVR